MSDPKPYGSIIERYKGTPWEVPEPPPPPPPKGRGRGPIIVVAAILVVAGGGLAAAWTLLGGVKEAEPVPGAFHPGVTARVPDSMRVSAAFWTLVRTKDLAYHLDGSGSSSATGFSESFTLSLDVVGDDYAGTVNTIDGSGKADLVRLDGVVYIRPAGQAWVLARTSDAILRQVPFGGIEGEAQLRYDGPVHEAGMTHHRLVTTALYHPSVARMLDLAQFTLQPDTAQLELIVDDDGQPIRATFTCIVNGSLADGVPHFEGSASYTYTAFGEPATIVAPVK